MTNGYVIPIDARFIIDQTKLGANLIGTGLSMPCKTGLMLSKLLIHQIESLDRRLIETSFSISNNYVSSKNGTISWSGKSEISYALRNQSYEEVYTACINENAYNYKLIDGAIIQLMYEVCRNKITKHRLCYLPNPHSERFIDSPEDFEDANFGENLFSDMLNKKAVAFPIRIDYDHDHEKYVEHFHSFSHLTLGNYSTCRIPTIGPVSPFKFVRFILTSFYLERFQIYFSPNDFMCNMISEKTISRSELNHVHFAH